MEVGLFSPRECSKKICLIWAIFKVIFDVSYEVLVFCQVTMWEMPLCDDV